MKIKNEYFYVKCKESKFISFLIFDKDRINFFKILDKRLLWFKSLIISSLLTN